MKFSNLVMLTGGAIFRLAGCDFRRGGSDESLLLGVCSGAVETTGGGLGLTAPYVGGRVFMGICASGKLFGMLVANTFETVGILECVDANTCWGCTNNACCFCISC